jgi:phosphotransferase system HPr-like phosphotransfer protein
VFPDAEFDSMSDQQREAIVTEALFASVLRDRMANPTRHLSKFASLDRSQWDKPTLMNMAVVSHELETFLDDHGARNNKAFSYLAECVASIRGLSKAAVALMHLAGRFERYQVALQPEVQAQFSAQTRSATTFLIESIARLTGSALEELALLGIPTTKPDSALANVTEVTPRVVLPHNIDEQNVFDEEEQIAEVATKYLAVADRAAQISDKYKKDSDLREFVLRNLDEERARALESQIHSVQSKYDTFIRMTTLESRTTALPRLRGHASLALHLLEVAVELVHFYVRHENDVRYVPAKERISRLVNKDEVLGIVVHYCLQGSRRVLDGGREFAQEVLKIFVATSEITISLAEGVVLHARPVSLIVRIVARYGTPVRMELGSESCSAGSIMEMILAVGSNPSARTVRFVGDARALSDIRLLFEHRLGEDGIVQLPAQLGYLKS